MSKEWHWHYPLTSSLIFTIGIACGGFSIVYPEAHFRLNLSESLPEKLFISMPSSPPFEKGQIVSIDHPELQTTVGKIIVGKPGDRITIHDGVVFLNEVEIGSCKSVSLSGKQYHPLSEGVVLENSYFVYTPHADSFDSRYAEFGLVKEEWIKEVLWPLF